MTSPVLDWCYFHLTFGWLDGWMDGLDDHSPRGFSGPFLQYFAGNFTRLLEAVYNESKEVEDAPPPNSQ